jgi:hypothetical protein
MSRFKKISAKLQNINSQLICEKCGDFPLTKYVGLMNPLYKPYLEDNYYICNNCKSCKILSEIEEKKDAD